MVTRKYLDSELNKIVQSCSSEFSFKKIIRDDQHFASEMKEMAKCEIFDSDSGRLWLYYLKIWWIVGDLYKRFHNAIEDWFDENRKWIESINVTSMLIQERLNKELMPGVLELRKELTNRLRECKVPENRIIDFIRFATIENQLFHTIHQTRVAYTKKSDELLQLPENDLLDHEIEEMILESAKGSASIIKERNKKDGAVFPFVSRSEIKYHCISFLLHGIDDEIKAINAKLPTEIRYKLPLKDIEISYSSEYCFKCNINKRLRLTLLENLLKDVAKEDINLLDNFLAGMPFTHKIHYNNNRKVLYYLFQKLKKNENIDGKDIDYNASVIKQWFIVKVKNSYEDLDKNAIYDALARKPKLPKTKKAKEKYSHIDTSFES